MKGINIPPYYDDFDPDKNYVQILFRPEVEVQSRELTQIQTIIADQIEKFGRHIFKEGSPVYGGAYSVVKVDAVYVDLDEGVSINDFEGTVEFVDSDGNVVAKGEVAVVYEKDDRFPNTIGVSFITKERPEPGHVVRAKNKKGITGKVANRADAVHKALMGHMQDGVYFLGGRFVKVEQDRGFLDPSDPVPTGWAGMIWEEVIITADDDPSLLNPALGAANYASEGAHRLAIRTKLYFVRENEEEPANFVPLIEIEQGRPKTVPVRPVHSEIGKMIARRTWEESGDYTVQPFVATAEEGYKLLVRELGIGENGDRRRVRIKTAINHNLKVGDPINIQGVIVFENGDPEGGDEAINGRHTITEVLNDNEFVVVLDQDPDPRLPTVLKALQPPYNGTVSVIPVNEFLLSVSEGSAYVRGNEIDLMHKTRMRVPRARDTKIFDTTIPTMLGNVVYVTNVTGYLDQWATVSLDDASGSQVAQARVVGFSHHHGPYGANGVWKVHLFDIRVTPGKLVSDIRKVSAPSFTADVASDSFDANGNFVIKDQGKNRLVQKLAYNAVSSLLPTDTSNFSYRVWKKYNGTAAGGSVTFNITGNNERFIGSTTDFSNTSIWNENYVLVRDDTNEIVNPSSVVVGIGYDAITCEVPANVNYTLLACVQVDRAYRKKIRKTKDVAIPHSAWSSTDKVGLGITDAIEIVSVFDSGTPGVAATDSDEKTTAQYVLHPNRTPWAYLESEISRIGKPKGDILVRVDYYDHVGSTGPFVVDSYVNHVLEEIPVEEINGEEYRLFNCVDWRPTIVGSSISGGVPKAGGVLDVDAEVYLQRADIVVLADNGSIMRIEGKPRLEHWAFEPTPENAMLLFKLKIPAYTFSHKDVKIDTIDNRRYTMRDIGHIDKRLKRVEYYTQLSLLEMRVKSEPVYDKEGRERFKNGFIVDDFKSVDEGIGWKTHAEFKCYVLPQNHECRCKYSVHFENTTLKSGVSFGVKHGHGKNTFYTLPYDEEVLVQNLNPTKKEFVTPYLQSDYVGKLTFDPPWDDWYDDTHTKKEITLDMGDIEASVTVNQQQNNNNNPFRRII